MSRKKWLSGTVNLSGIVNLSSTVKTVIPAIIMIAVLSMISLSCAGGPEPAAVLPAEEVPTEEMPPVPAPEAAEPVAIVETVYLVTMERSFFGDGSLDTSRIYTYVDESVNPVTEDLYSAEEVLLEREVYTLGAEGLPVERKTLNSDGSVRTIRRYTYDENGRLFEEALLNPQEELQSSSVYEYDRDGNRVKWSVFSGAGTLLGYTEYRYENNLPVRSDNFAPDGQLEEYLVTEYGSTNLPEKISQFDAAGRLQEYRALEYDGSGLVRETWHRANRSVRRSVTYRNNSGGYPETIIYLDGGNTVRERRERDYMTRESIRYE